METTYVYDALNRNTTTNYSDTTVNPDVKRFYDAATNGKGRFGSFYSGGDYSTGANVDHTAIDSYDALGRPLVQRQLFKLTFGVRRIRRPVPTIAPAASPRKPILRGTQ